MKICFVHEEYPKETNFGGIATYQKIMAEYYANHGDNVYVVSRGKCDEEYIENNVHIIRVSSDNDANNFNSVRDYRRKLSVILKKLQDANKIEIIETPDWGANTVYFEKDRKIPIVVRLHTPLKIWLDYNNNDFGKTKNLILKWENLMLKKADVITSCSELLKNIVCKQYKIDKDIIVIQNPYNNKDFNVISNNKNNNLIYVGSLEERKGALILARALNEIMSVIDNNCIYVVGKDTIRNNKNISTKEYMLTIIDKKFHDRIKFVGQVDNKEVNVYLNKSYLAIFPSIFDNYPYTILEAMASGKHIVCSDNIGNANLVMINNLVFKTNDYKDLVNKVLELFNERREYINYSNIEIVKENCNQSYICNQMKEIYLEAIKQYKKSKIEELEIIEVLNKVIKFNQVRKIKKFTGNLANVVYGVFTNNGNYVIKKYNYNYDFDNCNELCNIYESNNIKIVRPINNEIVVVKNNRYNIFNYIKCSNGKIKNDYIMNLINVDRKTNKKANVLIKCDKYYDYLINLSSYSKIIEQDEFFVINEYAKLKKMPLFNEQYLNHGDLSFVNIIFNNNCPYVIDFDETIITTKLYDFAVILVKLNIINSNLTKEEILEVITRLMPDSNYSIDDYINVIKFYLCKILLEKFYLFENNIIDLFSKIQMRDNYKKYIKLLKKINIL